MPGFRRNMDWFFAGTAGFFGGAKSYIRYVDAKFESLLRFSSSNQPVAGPTHTC
jgi:hypothetical protein